jgi:hypothetical protein
LLYHRAKRSRQQLITRDSQGRWLMLYVGKDGIGYFCRMKSWRETWAPSAEPIPIKPVRMEPSRLDREDVERISGADCNVLLAVQQVRDRPVADVRSETGVPQNLSVRRVEGYQVLRGIACE